MKIPIWLATNPTNTIGGICYFNSDPHKAELASAGAEIKAASGCKYGHEHVPDAIVYWVVVKEVSIDCFK